MNVYPAQARGSRVIVKYDGKEIELGSSIENLRYTDNASGRLDDIILTIDKNKTDWMPESGKDLDVSIELFNWYVNGDELSYHCGNFCIDDISINGIPYQLVVKGISQPAESDFKESKKNKTWKKVSLKQIALEIMAAAGMTKLYFNAEDILIESIEQSEKTDSEFLSELCRKYGLSLKIYKVGLVIFNEDWYEAQENVPFFGKYPEWSPYNTNEGFEDWPTHEIKPNWTWNSTLQGTYTGVELSYTDAASGKSISVKLGDGPRILQLNERADSLGDAERIARNRVNEENKKQETMIFSPALFHPTLFASNVIEIKNLGRPDGRYFVERISVSLSSGGISEIVSIRKCFPRL